MWEISAHRLLLKCMGWPLTSVSSLHSDYYPVFFGSKSFLFGTAYFSLWGNCRVNYIVTNSINCLLIGSRCIPNGAQTNHCWDNLAHGSKSTWYYHTLCYEKNFNLLIIVIIHYRHPKGSVVLIILNLFDTETIVTLTNDELINSDQDIYWLTPSPVTNITSQ